MRWRFLVFAVLAGCSDNNPGSQMILDPGNGSIDLGTENPSSSSGDMARAARADMRMPSMDPNDPMNPMADMAGMPSGSTDMAQNPQPTNPTLTLVFTPDKNRTATGLGFHKTRDELWIV